MAQSLVNRHGQRKPPAYWETIRDRINTAKAAQLLTDVVEGKEIPPQQERVALFIVNKFCPNLAAIAVQVEDMRPESKQDINALLTTTGINPAQVWAALQGVAENPPIEHAPGGPPTPPDRDE